jgi:hypothetical protein
MKSTILDNQICLRMQAGVHISILDCNAAITQMFFFRLLWYMLQWQSSFGVEPG